MSALHSYLPLTNRPPPPHPSLNVTPAPAPALICDLEGYITLYYMYYGWNIEQDEINLIAPRA